MKRTSIIDYLPDLDTSFVTLAFLLEKFLLVRACGGELVGKGVEIDGEYAVFEAVPADVGGIDAHKLAADYIIVQSPL